MNVTDLPAAVLNLPGDFFNLVMTAPPTRLALSLGGINVVLLAIRLLDKRSVPLLVRFITLLGALVVLVEATGLIPTIYSLKLGLAITLLLLATEFVHSLTQVYFFIDDLHLTGLPGRIRELREERRAAAQASIDTE